MKTLKQIKIFCQGFHEGWIASEGTTVHAEEWVIWDDYDINLLDKNEALEVLNAVQAIMEDENAKS